MKLTKGKIKNYSRRHLRIKRNAQRRTEQKTGKQLSAARRARRALWA